MMRNFLLMIVALVLVIVFFLPSLLLQTLRHLVMNKSLGDLWFAVAIGLDQLGGSIIYLEPDWTVSSRTYYLRTKGNIYAAWSERFINFFFGKDHCESSYNNEFGTLNKVRGG